MSIHAKSRDSIPSSSRGYQFLLQVEKLLQVTGFHYNRLRTSTEVQLHSTLTSQIPVVTIHWVQRFSRIPVLTTTPEAKTLKLHFNKLYLAVYLKSEVQWVWLKFQPNCVVSLYLTPHCAQEYMDFREWFPYPSFYKCIVW